MQSIPEKVHFIGIGGAGMSGLAQILLGLGHRVSGSDLNHTPVTERLASLGAIIFRGHRPENVGNPGLVVLSSAIPKDNPELVEARRKGIPVIHRSDLLAMLMKRQVGIAVSGAHGKTTTTSMIGWTLDRNGLDPTIVVGGELTAIGGNAKLGHGKYLVAEADESDGSFLKLAPEVAVITNIEDDHLDYYGKFEAILSAFAEFLHKVPADGLAVVCKDDPNVCRIIEDYHGPLLTYGLTNKDADYTVASVSLNGTGVAGEVFFRGKNLGLLRLAVPGRHNLANALAAVSVGHYAGLPFSAIAEALRTFKGAGRRFQLLGEVRGVKVVDDYAHHPSEILATLEAARQVKPARIISVFQPHRYTRTFYLHERFGQVFSGADEVIVNEIYGAGEKPMAGVDAGLIVKSIQKNGMRNVKYLPEREKIVDYLAETVQPGDMVLTMGAGNIWTVGVQLLQRLKGSAT